jgi:hypothetical protein
MMTMKTESLVYTAEIHNGDQRVYRFPNGWGASVVRHEFSHGGDDGLWELAVITWDGKGDGRENWEITYATPITSDVLGYLTIGKVNDLLDQIRALPRELPPVVRTERVLWVSRHEMTEAQREALHETRRVVNYPEQVSLDIIYINLTLPAPSGDAVKAILAACEDWDTGLVAGVLPAHVAAQWMQMEVQVPLYLPVSVPAPAVEGEVRGGGFTFSHWEAF